MMPLKFALVFASTVLMAATGALAQDIAGASDHPLVGRYAGAEIVYYDRRAYDEIALPGQVVPDGEARTPESWMSNLAGTVTSIRYDGPEGRSALEVMRNYQQALEEGGFETVVFCTREECAGGGGISSFWDEARGGIGMPTTWDTSIYLLARSENVHAALLSVETGSGTAVVPHVAVTVVETEKMDSDQIAFVEASAMEEAFAQEGRIAIYGIYFDFDSAALQPESDVQIAELARLLEENIALEVVIVGHTDSIGNFDYNLDLSQRRAQAVVDTLVSQYGVDTGRLTPAGAGMVAPVTTNRTEEGRGRNRRVEIVEIHSER